MAISMVYEQKKKIIYEFLSRLSDDEKKILLQKMIKDDMKLFFETIFDEQKFLEEETGITGAELLENTSDKYWHDEEDAGKTSKEAENAYYLDEKKKKNDKFDGFLGYINDSGDTGDEQT